MRALASGVALANEIGCDYSIVWRCNSELNAFATDLFNLPKNIKERITYPSYITYILKYSAPRKKYLLLSQIIAPLYFGNILRDSMQEFIKMKLNNEYDKIKDIVAKTINSGRDCLIQSGIHFYPFPEELYRDIFKPTETIEKRCEERINSLGVHPIGLHIRRSDNLESIKHSPDKLFMDEMDAIISANPNVKFYLATDDESTKTEFSKKYGDRILFSMSASNRNTQDGMKEAAVEMFVLSRTNRILGSYYSSFSEAAALLGNKTLTQVFR